MAVVHSEEADVRVGCELHVPDARGNLQNPAVLAFAGRAGLPRAEGWRPPPPISPALHLQPGVQPGRTSPGQAPAPLLLPSCPPHLGASSPVLGCRAPLCLWPQPVPASGQPRLAGWLRAPLAMCSGLWGTLASGHIKDCSSCPSPISHLGREDGLCPTCPPPCPRRLARAWSNALGFRGNGH